MGKQIHFGLGNSTGLRDREVANFFGNAQKLFLEVIIVLTVSCSGKSSEFLGTGVTNLSRYMFGLRVYP